MKKHYKMIPMILLTLIILLSVKLEAVEKKVLPPDDAVGRKGKILSNTIMVRFKKEYAAQLGLSANMHGFMQAGNMLHIPGASIERPILHPKTTYTYNQNKKKQDKTMSADQINKIKAAEEPLLRTFVVEFTGNTDPEKYCFKLMENNPAIEIAEPYYLHRPMSHAPNDPMVSSQSVLQVIGAFDAWDDRFMRGDTSIIIGISDGGINQAHEDLHDNIAPNWEEIPNNGVDDDSNGVVDDYLGCNLATSLDGRSGGDTYFWDSHGTHVAGIAAAHTNNSTGMAGVGYQCRFFPIKMADYSSSRIDLYFSYESIVYAAIRGCKVLNCSWGSADYEYSDLHQSMINYALANDVAIVAAGGNLEGEPEMAPFWPANYNGVLGVGEVDLEDNYYYGSAKGPQIDIVVNGDNLTVDGNYQYIQSSHGTSHAAPVISGCVGLIRAKYPELSAIQALEYTRQCTDDISDKNFQYSKVIPGRINLLKALEIEPFSIPSIRPDNKILKTYINERYDLYDTIDLYIDVTNYLGEYDGLTFVISPITENQTYVKIISDTVVKEHVDKDEKFALGPFKIRIDRDHDLKMLFRMDIFNKQTGYKDFFMFHFIPQSIVTTFANDVIEFSVSDKGLLGYNLDEYYYKYGSSFIYDGDRRWYKGGLVMAEESSQKVVTTVRLGSYNLADLKVVKPFENPDNTGIVNDDNESLSNQIGLEVEQDYTIASGNNAFYKVKLTARNTTEYVKNGVSIGYYIDWDIGTHYDSNYIRLYPEGIPDGLNSNNAGVELMTDGDNTPLFACMVYSDESGAEPQLQGTIESTDLMDALNSGTANQPGTNEVGDVSMVAGMKFTESWQPDEEKEFYVCMCAGKTEEELKRNLRNCAQGNSVKEQIPAKSGLYVSPQPANGEMVIGLNIENPGNTTIKIFDLLGNEVLPETQRYFAAGNSEITLDISSLSPGVYFIRAYMNGKYYRQQFMVN